MGFPRPGRPQPPTVFDNVEMISLKVNRDISALNIKANGTVMVAADAPPAISGLCTKNDGVVGQSMDAKRSGVWADNQGGGHGVTGTSDAEGGIGVYGRGQKYAGYFEGDVFVTGNLTYRGEVLKEYIEQDFAEDFDISESSSHSVIEAGTVMVLDREGTLMPSSQAYDKRVAGIVSGAGGYRPAMILGRGTNNTLQQPSTNTKTRLPVALIGKVYCKADASNSPIEKSATC